MKKLKYKVVIWSFVILNHKVNYKGTQVQVDSYTSSK